MTAQLPRLVIAGISGDSGKTIVSLSLISALLKKRLNVSVFKKGPDYIDSAWLGMVAKATCHNLDTYMVQPTDVFSIFAKNALHSDIAVIEGNRGLYDGKDINGSHSTAMLAKLINSPVIIVVNATKVTLTLSAVILGCQAFDPDVKIAGVVLNRVAGTRHREILTESIRKYCSIPVVGVIPKLDKKLGSIIQSRHLGLITPSEYGVGSELDEKLSFIADEYLDVDTIINIAKSESALDIHKAEASREKELPKVKIGYFQDSVFTFYYPENLMELEKSGAQLVPVSSVKDANLPENISGLYIGGGFPETQAQLITSNKSMLLSVKQAADKGMPIYAECGGLIYLSRSIEWQDKKYPMVGVFPLDLKMSNKPAGHGYTQLITDRNNPYFEVGKIIKGHEFHYSTPLSSQSNIESCMQVETGQGVQHQRDGLIYNNTFAIYTHIHAAGVPEWAPAMVKNALIYQKSKN